MVTKVFDIANYGISWIAGKCSEEKDKKNVVFVTNGMLKSLVMSQLLRYGIRNIPVDVPEVYFASILQKRFIPVYKIVEMFRKRGLMRRKDIDDYVVYLWGLVNLYHTQKALEIENDEEFLSKYNPHQYITIEEYQTFKERYKELGITDKFDIVKMAYESNIKALCDNMFFIHSEDCYPLLKKTIEKIIQPVNLYLIGDEYKIKPAYAVCDNFKYDNEIDLGKAFQLPQNFYSSFVKAAQKIGFEKEIKTVHLPDTKVCVINNFNKAINYLNNKLTFVSAKIVYDYPIQCEPLESFLFHKNIPFKGVSERYKFPKDLYTISQVMISVINQTNPVTYKEFATVIKSIRGDITDKFGGKKKLLKHFCLPVFNPKTIGASAFFNYLRKAWISKTFSFCLQEDLKKKWVMWEGKLRKEWLEPRIFVGMPYVLKSLNTEISIYAQYPQSEERTSIIYSLLTTTQKEVIFSIF